jgi:hypothetical protein
MPNISSAVEAKYCKLAKNVLAVTVDVGAGDIAEVGEAPGLVQ